MSAPGPQRRRTTGTGLVIVFVVAAVGLRLWAVDAVGGAAAVLLDGGIVLLVGGGLSLVVWRQYAASGERMAAKARGMGFMAGSVWYSAAKRTDDLGSRGLLVVRRDGLAWLPLGLDPMAIRELPLGATLVHVDQAAKAVSVNGLGSFRAHSVKGLRVALDTVGVPVG